MNCLKKIVESQINESREIRRKFRREGAKARFGQSWSEYWITPLHTLIVLFSAIIILVLDLVTHASLHSNFTALGKLLMIPGLIVTFAIFNFLVYGFICETFIFPKMGSLNESIKDTGSDDQPFHMITKKVFISTLTTTAILTLWAFINHTT